MTETKLIDYFYSTIVMLRGTHSIKTIERAFEDAMEQACPPRAPASSLLASPAPLTPTLTSTLTVAEQRAIMEDFEELYGDSMNSKEQQWFNVMKAVVNGGRSLTGGQIGTVNSITHRIAGMAIIQ